MNGKLEYKQWLTNPNERLFLPLSCKTLWDRYDYLQGTIDADWLVDIACTIPLPNYSNVGELDRSQLWSEVLPIDLWHPIFWLPPQLFARQLIELEEDNEVIQEPDGVWLLRLALELENSKLYDKSTGKWLDIFSLVDIDPNSKEGAQRVFNWLDTGVDDALNDIDLSPYFRNGTNPEPFFNLALKRYDTVAIIGAYNIATELIEIAQNATNKQVIDGVATLASLFLAPFDGYSETSDNAGRAAQLITMLQTIRDRYKVEARKEMEGLK